MNKDRAEKIQSPHDSKLTWRDWLGVHRKEELTSVYEKSRGKVVTAINSIIDTDGEELYQTDVSLAVFGINHLARADYFLGERDSLYDLGTVLEELSDKHDGKHGKDVFSIYFDAGVLGQSDAQKRIWNLLQLEKRGMLKGDSQKNIVFFDDNFPLAKMHVVKQVEHAITSEALLDSIGINDDHRSSLQLTYFEEAKDEEGEVSEIAKKHLEAVTERFLQSRFDSPMAGIGIAGRLYSANDDSNIKQDIFRKFEKIAGDVPLEINTFKAFVRFGSAILKSEPRVTQDVKNNFEENMDRNIAELIKQGYDTNEVERISAYLKIAFAYYDDPSPQNVSNAIETVYLDQFLHKEVVISNDTDDSKSSEYVNNIWDNASSDWAEFYADKGDFDGVKILLRAISDDDIRAEAVCFISSKVKSEGDFDTLRPEQDEDTEQIPRTLSLIDELDALSVSESKQFHKRNITAQGKSISERVRHGTQLMKLHFTDIRNSKVERNSFAVYRKRIYEKLVTGDSRELARITDDADQLDNYDALIRNTAVISVVSEMLAQQSK